MPDHVHPIILEGQVSIMSGAVESVSHTYKTFQNFDIWGQHAILFNAVLAYLSVHLLRNYQYITISRRHARTHKPKYTH